VHADTERVRQADQARQRQAVPARAAELGQGRQLRSSKRPTVACSAFQGWLREDLRASVAARRGCLQQTIAASYTPGPLRRNEVVVGLSIARSVPGH
jgi:hypothetical protein